MLRNMKDTLRRKSYHKSLDLDTDNKDVLRTITNGSTPDGANRTHQRSISNQSVMPGGPEDKGQWHDEGFMSSPIRPTADESNDRGRAENLQVPGSQRSERSVSEKPTRRRKKTLNQVTPHRFELVDAKRDSMRPPVPLDSRSATPTEDLVVSRTRESRRESEIVVQKLDFSEPQAVADVEPVLPKPTRGPRSAFSRINVSASISPIEPAKPPKPIITTLAEPKQPNGIGLDFMNDFGLKRDDAISQYIASPITSSYSQQRSPFATSFLPQHRHEPRHEPWTYHPPSNPLPANSLTSKVIVLTNGTSLISAPLVRTLHSAGARIIFSSPPHLADKARAFIRELGPPDTVHFNICDLGSYDDIHSLFKLGMTMYGRIDHAVFAPGDDGGHVRGVGMGEKLWGLDTGLTEGRSITTKAELEIIERSTAMEAVTNIDMADVVGASIRFARIAIAYLRNSPGRRQRHTNGNVALSPASAGGFTDSAWSEDRSLTFVTSTAAFVPVAYLPVYSAAQHALLGVGRSLGESVDVRRDGVRVNTVATNMLLPSVVEAKGGGRMSVRLPGDKGEDVGHVVAGLISNSESNEGRGLEEGELHGRVLYVTDTSTSTGSGNGIGAVDVQDGLQISQHSWLGDQGKEALDRASGSADGVMGKGRWMLLDGAEGGLL